MSDLTANLTTTTNLVATLSGDAWWLTWWNKQSIEVGTFMDTKVVIATDNDMDETSIPLTTDFVIKVNGVSATINSVTISGTWTILLLNSAVSVGDTITLNYTRPVANPYKELGGKFIPSVTNQSVTNNVTLPITLALNGGHSTTTDWVDSNSDGLADGYFITGGTASIVTGSGFTGNAQRLDADGSIRYLQPVTQSEGFPYLRRGVRYHFSFKYRSSSAIVLTNFGDNQTFALNTGNAIYAEAELDPTINNNIRMSIAANEWFEISEVNIYAKSANIMLIVAGQSNARGNGSVVANIPNRLKNINANTWEGSSFDLVNMGVNYAQNIFSSELSFCVDINNHWTRQPNFYNYSVAGSSIRANADPDWYPDSTELYTTLVTEVTQGQAALSNFQTCFYWMQGEADVDVANSAAYKTPLDYFLDSLFAAISVDFSVIGRLHGTGGGWDYVRTAQGEVVSERDDMELLDTDDYTTIDGLHFDNDSLIESGESVFDKFNLYIKSAYGRY